jgi:hypothetical protein
MVSGHQRLAVDDVLDHVVVDSDGRLLVALIDVLAIVRLDSDADLLLVEFADGSSRALRLCAVFERGDVYLQLRIDGSAASGGEGWLGCLWSADAGSSPPVSSIRAVTFCSFVGLE